MWGIFSVLPVMVVANPQKCCTYHADSCSGCDDLLYNSQCTLSRAGRHKLLLGARTFGWNFQDSLYIYELCTNIASTVIFHYVYEDCVLEHINM
jgi:hypothetical protein